MNDFSKELVARVELANEIIEEYLPKEEGFQKTVIEAMNYSVRAGGKRIRPILMAETYKLFAKDNKANYDALKKFMAAIEMIHTYSLIHDDLPDMDNDMYRRGMLTCHAKFGAAMAILAGDGLHGYAYEVTTKAFNPENDYDRVAKAISLLADKPGLYGMLGGQAVDVENDKGGNKLTKEQLDFIYRLKTGALIETSMGIGAILAGASDKEVDKILEAAIKVGIAFQIQDDVLDVLGDEAVLGKPIGSDDKNNKTTYVTLYGIDQAKEYVQTLSDEAISIVEKYENSEFLVALIKMLITREK